MEKIGASTVATEGFGLIRRRPVAVLVWGLILTLVQTVIPTGLILWLMFAPGSELYLAMESGAGLDPESMLAFQLKANLIQWVMTPLSILASTVVTAAVLRTVLEPERRSYFSMRLGAAEGWMLVVGVVMVVMALIICVPTVGLIALVCYALALSSKSAAILVGALLAMAALAGYLWLGARFYMAMPLTFTAQKFRLFESWALTKGHVWWIVRVWLVLIAMIFGLAILCGLLIGVPLVIALMPVLQAIPDADPMPWVMQHLGSIAGWGVVLGIIWLVVSSFWTGALVALAATPGARVFQILTAPEAEASVVVDEPLPPELPEPA